MFWQTVFCILAALGLVLSLWLLFGARALPFRPRRGQIAWLWRAEGNEEALLRQYEAYAWLRESGLGPMRLILWDAGLEPAARHLAQQWAERDARITLVDGSQRIDEIL